MKNARKVKASSGKNCFGIVYLFCSKVFLSAGKKEALNLANDTNPVADPTALNIVYNTYWVLCFHYYILSLYKYIYVCMLIIFVGFFIHKFGWYSTIEYTIWLVEL
jgi:hypothetical protein